MCAIYSVAWALYSIQSFLGISSLAKFLLVFIIVFSAYKMVYVISKYKLERFMKGLNLLFFMFTIYGLLYYFFGETYYVRGQYVNFEVPKFYYLKYVYCSLLPIYVYYDYAKKGVFTQESLFRYAIFFISISILGFFSYMLGRGMEIDIENGMTNNMAYRFLPILALIFLFKRWRIALMLICFVFVMMGLKRGAIAVGSIYIFIHLRYMIKEQKSSSRKLLAFLSVLALLVVMSVFVMRFYESSSYFQSRLSATLEGDASGRDVIYTYLYNYYMKEANPFVFIFGNGADATVRIIGNYAHNDWLELAINQGALGISVYLLFYVCWYKDWRKLRDLPEKGISGAFGLLLLGSFLSSWFSMAYTGFTPVSAIVIGYSLSKLQKNSFRRI